MPEDWDSFKKVMNDRKIRMMYGIPSKEEGRYPFLGFSREEYPGFLDRAVDIVTAALREQVEQSLTRGER